MKRYSGIAVFFLVFGLILDVQADSHPTLALESVQEFQYKSTNGVDYSDPLREKADELKTPVAIYEFVRNHFEYVPYHGSRSGAANTFLGKRGNDVDQASTLIAMLRSQGIPARYVVGYGALGTGISLSNWTGIQNSVNQDPSAHPDAEAMSWIVSAGIPTLINGEMTGIEHVWVEALVPMHDYRGAGSNAEERCDPVAPASHCVWVPLAPSIKSRQENRERLSVLRIQETDGDHQFSYDDYYLAERIHADNNYKGAPIEHISCSTVNRVDYRDSNPLYI